MNRQELRKALNEIATQVVPSNHDLWPMLRERLTTPRHSRQWVRLLPSTRVGWLGFILFFLFVFSITAYAAAPWISRLLERDERLKNIDLSLSQAVNQSQTIDDVTVMVEWVYADSDWVLVGYAMRSTNGKRFDPYHEMLMDKTGATFPWQGTYGVTGQSDVLQINLPAGEGTYAAIFKNTSAFGWLDLQFEVSAQEIVLDTAQVAPTAVTTEPEVILTPVRRGSIIGPFIYSFSVTVSEEKSH